MLRNLFTRAWSVQAATPSKVTVPKIPKGLSSFSTITFFQQQQQQQQQTHSRKQLPRLFHTAFPARLAEKQEEKAQQVSADKVSLRFASPTTVFFDVSKKNQEVDMVSIPSVGGELGVLPNAPGTIAELQPGVISVHLKDKEIKKYFVSGGFAVIKEGSHCSISVPEAVLVDDLDPDAVNRGLQQYQQQVEQAKDEKDKAIAQIGVEVHTRMKYALESK